MELATSRQPVAFTTIAGFSKAFMVMRAVAAGPQPVHSLWPGPKSSWVESSFKVTIKVAPPRTLLAHQLVPLRHAEEPSGICPRYQPASRLSPLDHILGCRPWSESP